MFLEAQDRANTGRCASTCIVFATGLHFKHSIRWIKAKNEDGLGKDSKVPMGFSKQKILVFMFWDTFMFLSFFSFFVWAFYALPTSFSGPSLLNSFYLLLPILFCWIKCLSNHYNWWAYLLVKNGTQLDTYNEVVGLQTKRSKIIFIIFMTLKGHEIFKKPIHELNVYI